MFVEIFVISWTLYTTLGMRSFKIQFIPTGNDYFLNYFFKVIKRLFYGLFSLVKNYQNQLLKSQLQCKIYIHSSSSSFSIHYVENDMF